MGLKKENLSELSLNQLGELTGLSYRVIKERLKGLSPSNEDDRCRYYFPRDALPLLFQVQLGKKNDLNFEKTRLVKAQADRAEYEFDALKADLVSVTDVKSEWHSLVASFRSKILGLPTKLSPVLARLPSAVEIESELKASIHEALEELSNG